MSEEFVESFLPRHDAAHARFLAGDPELWLQLWSHSEPVSAFGGFGYIATCRDQVEAVTRKASVCKSSATRPTPQPWNAAFPRRTGMRRQKQRCGLLKSTG